MPRVVAFETQKDYVTKRGRLSPSTLTSSSSSFVNPSSSHPIDDDNDRNGEASSSNPPKKIKLTLILPRKLFVELTQQDDKSHTPSSIVKSSSPSPPNALSKTPSTTDTSFTFETTSSSFESKPCSLPFSSRTTPSPQPTNPFLDDPLDAPPRSSNPLLFQSNPSLDINLSLSPINSLDNMFKTLSPPSPPLPPQLPLMGYPIFLNVIDYHGAHFYVAFIIAISSFLFGMICTSCFLILNIFSLPPLHPLIHLTIEHP
uniref:Uncharacterized protein n=1 Tax=Tanacetum cinerariifolium TaxID=118510 RepID=A0A699IX83_TANCI|nr:hypothetical protein [Tanacetum cinerariifolium]